MNTKRSPESGNKTNIPQFNNRCRAKPRCRQRRNQSTRNSNHRKHQPNLPQHTIAVNYYPNMKISGNYARDMVIAQRFFSQKIPKKTLAQVYQLTTQKISTLVRDPLFSSFNVAHADDYFSAAVSYLIKLG